MCDCALRSTHCCSHVDRFSKIGVQIVMFKFCFIIKLKHRNWMRKFCVQKLWRSEHTINGSWTHIIRTKWYTRFALWDFKWMQKFCDHISWEPACRQHSLTKCILTITSEIIYLEQKIGSRYNRKEYRVFSLAIKWD